MALTGLRPDYDDTALLPDDTTTLVEVGRVKVSTVAAGSTTTDIPIDQHMNTVFHFTSISDFKFSDYTFFCFTFISTRFRFLLNWIWHRTNPQFYFTFSCIPEFLQFTHNRYQGSWCFLSHPPERTGRTNGSQASHQPLVVSEQHDRSALPVHTFSILQLHYQICTNDVVCKFKVCVVVLERFLLVIILFLSQWQFLTRSGFLVCGNDDDLCHFGRHRIFSLYTILFLFNE